IRQFLRTCTNSIGSSTVTMWPFMRVFMSSIIAARVVDLPEPVLPVTRIRPLFTLQRLRTASGMFSWSSVSALDGMARHTQPAVQVPHHVDAEARDTGDDVGEVRTVLLFQPLLRGARHDLAQRLFDELRRQNFLPQRLQLAIQADARRVVRDEVQVGAVAAQNLLQVFVDAPRDVGIRAGADWLGAHGAASLARGRTSAGRSSRSRTSRTGACRSRTRRRRRDRSLSPARSAAAPGRASAC